MKVFQRTFFFFALISEEDMERGVTCRVLLDCSYNAFLIVCVCAVKSESGRVSDGMERMENCEFEASREEESDRERCSMSARLLIDY